MILPEDINRLHYPEIEDRVIEDGHGGDFFCDIVWLPIIVLLDGHRRKVGLLVLALTMLWATKTGRY